LTINADNGRRFGAKPLFSGRESVHAGRVTVWARLRRGATRVLETLLECAGVASVVYGCWLMYEPAAWIVGGLAGFGMSYTLQAGDRDG